MKHKIGIAGSILLDVVKMIDAWPDKGMLVNILSVSRSVGGCVCNTATDLKILDPDLSVSVFGKIGKDEYGKFLFQRMNVLKLNTSGLSFSPKINTSFTDVMTIRETGERTFFHSRGANSEFSVDDIDVEALDCEIFHLGYLLLLDRLDEADERYGTKAAKLLHDVQARGIKTSVDLVSEQSERFAKVIVPALKYCDYVIINEIEGARLSGISFTDTKGKISLNNLKKICEKIRSLGVRESVVIHCPRLSCSLDKNNRFTYVGSLELPDGYIVGAVGAGDAFCAGMLYAFLTAMPEETGMRLASCLAACNLAAADSVSGARNLKETLDLEKKYPRRRVVC